jgi:hypothetical protein
MEPIKRIGPPTPTGVRGGEYDLSVPLSATPCADWRRAFHAPDEWEEPCHPSRVTVKDRALTFTSEEAHVRLWIQRIDKWIAAANDACAGRPESVARQEVSRSDDERELARRLREAAERYKDL